MGEGGGRAVVGKCAVATQGKGGGLEVVGTCAVATQGGTDAPMRSARRFGPWPASLWGAGFEHSSVIAPRILQILHEVDLLHAQILEKCAWWQPIRERR